MASMTLVVALRKYVLPAGTPVSQIMTEFKALTDQDKVDLRQQLRAEGIEVSD